MRAGIRWTVGDYGRLPEDLRLALERHNRLHDLVHDSINSMSSLDLNLKWLRDAHAYNDAGKTSGMDIRFEELEQVLSLLQQAEEHMGTFVGAIQGHRSSDETK
jgi:hypothetical protein